MLRVCYCTIQGSPAQPLLTNQAYLLLFFWTLRLEIKIWLVLILCKRSDWKDLRFNYSVSDPRTQTFPLLGIQDLVLSSKVDQVFFFFSFMPCVVPLYTPFSLPALLEPEKELFTVFTLLLNVPTHLLLILHFNNNLRSSTGPSTLVKSLNQECIMLLASLNMLFFHSCFC